MNLRLEANWENLAALQGFVRERLEAAGMDHDGILRAEMGFEEVITNVIKYAYPDEPGDAVVEVTTGNPGVCIRVIDEGPAFNPLDQPLPEIRENPDSVEEGGLGIYLTIQFAKGITYRRENDQNIVEMVFPLRVE